MAETSALWKIIQRWLDLQPFPPSQSKLGKAVGVERSAVSDWKSGKTRPTPEHLRSLSALLEPTLGPDTYTMLMVALMSDMGYGYPSLEAFRDRVPRGRFEPVDDPNSYSVVTGLPTEEEYDIMRAVRSRGDATAGELATLQAAGVLPRMLQIEDVGRWLTANPERTYGFAEEETNLDDPVREAVEEAKESDAPQSPPESQYGAGA